ncbi:MAG: MipA/OmpV family protein [Granulosicoccus sp.]
MTTPHITKPCCTLPDTRYSVQNCARALVHHQVRQESNAAQSLVPTLLLTISLLLPAVVLAKSPPVEQDAFEVSVSAGVVSGPAYLGADEYQTSILPNITVKYNDRWSASLRGIKYIGISEGGWSAGPVLSYDFGREERIDDNPFAIATDDSTDLIGLGDVDGTLQLGGFVEYEARSFVAKLELHRGLDGGHDGLLGEASISYRGQLVAAGRSAFYSIGPAFAFGDDAYNSAFFDTSESQSVASGLSQFDADGGVSSFGLHGSVIMPLSKTISIVGFGQYDQLIGDVADSSIVTERGSRDQVTTGIFVNYRF